MTSSATVALPRSRFGEVQPWVTLVVRLGLAAVWLLAGVPKALNPRGTEIAVRAYRLLPESLVPLFAHVLPWVEIGLGVLLVVGIAVRWAGVASAVLLGMFLFGLASVWIRGISIDCGCFGGGGTVAQGDTNYPLELLRDSGLMIMALWLVAFPRSRFAFDPFAPIDED